MQRYQVKKIGFNFSRILSSFFRFVRMQAKHFKYEENESEMNYEKRNKNKIKEEANKAK
jgi:hypothetical protein